MSEQKDQVPITIHPDDAKDKVFAAILKALMKMGNTPSSPRELANTIVKHKYATLGGQTPFATVSSRISQHFKRAAQHNPPRQPLLKKHVDQHHSRKINYSLTTNDNKKKNMTTKDESNLSDSPNLSSEEDEHDDVAATTSTTSPIVNSNNSAVNRSSNDLNHQPRQPQGQKDNDDDIAAAIAITKLSQPQQINSEDEHSDYYEEMLLGSTTNTNESITIAKTPPIIEQLNKKPLSAVGENEYWAPFSFEQEFDNVFLSAENNANSPISIPKEFDTNKNINTPPSSTSPPPSSQYCENNKSNRRRSWPNDCNKLASSFTAGEEIKMGKKERFQIVTSTFKGHTFKITKKWIDDMEFYELDSPDDIPNTKVLRFIASTDTTVKHRSYRSSNNESCLLQGYINATQLRKAAMPVLGEGEFDLEEEKKLNKPFTIITKGSIEVIGTWVPLHRARDLIEDFEIESSPGLTKLLSDNPLEDDNNLSNNNNIEEDQSLSSQTSLDFSTQLTNTLINEANNNDSTNENTIIHNKELTTTEKKLPIIPIIPTAPKVRKHAKIAPSTKHLSTSEILKSMNIQNLNLSALQQSISNPNLAQMLPQHLSFAKNLEAYMQTISKASSSSSSNNVPVQDLKNVLSRIPLFDALLTNTKQQQKILPQPPQKSLFSDSNTTTTASSPSSSTSSQIISSTSSSEPLVIYPTIPTEPPMSITTIDHIAVCIAVLKKQEDNEEKEYQIMRRLDTGFINGTQLLTAGGIETESERSMILSFEMNRVRMPNKKSGLFGTWIPSRRALELAATCSIQNALGPFMNGDFESLFPSPLPIYTKKRSNSTPVSNHHHLAAMTLAGLKNSVHQTNRSVAKRDDANSSTLLTHPNNTLKMAENTLQAPLLGRFLDNDGNRKVSIIDTSVVSTPSSIRTVNEGDNNSDIDIEGEDSFMSDLLNLDEEESEDEETDTDNDVEEVRKNMRKIRDAAIAAMEIGNSMDLDDMFQNNSPPSKESKRRRKHSHGSHHRKRKNNSNKRVEGDSIIQDEDEESEEEEVVDLNTIKNHFIQSQHATPYKSFNYSRRRPSGIAGGTGGKWSASSVGKLAPTVIKRSATWSSSMDSPIHRRQKTSTKNVNSLSVVNATVVNNTQATKKDASIAPLAASILSKSSKKKSTALITHTVVNEEDEDEDVDIGGSDNDDDLR